jgi:ATP-dependent helicase/nuclease subunit A
VDAGAGSGKTRVLVERIVDLLETRRANLDAIVAITFTDKAAAEMKDRLRRAFHEKAPVDDPDVMSYWRDLERRVESARISTIHSFCSSLLRENALYVGRDPDFTVLADAEARLLRGEVIEETLQALIESGDAAALRAATELGVNAMGTLLGNMLSKRALLEEVRKMGVFDDPAAVRQYWAESVAAVYRARLADLKDSRALRRFRDELAAFDGQCAKASDKREILRRAMVSAIDELLPGVPPDRAAALMADLAGVTATSARSANWPSDRVFQQVKGIEDRVVAFAKQCAPPAFDDDVEVRAAQLTCDFYKTWIQVAEAFESEKAARVSVDFDNQILDARTMLQEHEAVRARVARGIRHLLIDEFQDTDPEQLEIVRLLADCPGGPDVFIVGDAKQSIYHFRGGEVEVFQGEKKTAEQVIHLDTNFRSTPAVLGFVNDFFARTGLLEAVEPEYRPLIVSRAPADECRIEFLVPQPDDHARADDYRRKEAELIAWRIASLRDGTGAARVSDKAAGDSRPASFGDVAILFRAMSNVYLYEEALRKRDIPYHVVAGAGFYERQEILDVHNLLTVVTDPWNEMALLGFLRSPLAGLSDESLLHLRLCDAGGLAAVFQSAATPQGLPAEQADRLEAVRDLAEDLRAHAEMPLPAFLRYVLNRTGYEAVLLSQFLGAQKACNVRKLLDLADDFARTRLPRLGAFVQYLDEVAGHEEIREGDAVLQPEGAGAVTLMTIHKAKGLEFPVVFVPDCSRMPNARETQPAAAHRTLGLAAKVTDARGERVAPAIMEEMARDRLARERAEDARVLYVAMTRARDWLFLSGAPEAREGTWFQHFDAEYGVLSRGDGDHFDGPGWQACVRRAPGEAKVTLAEAARHELPSREALAARAAPVQAVSTRRMTLSVTMLLDRMGFGAESEPKEETDTADDRLAMSPSLRGTLVHQMFEEWGAVGDAGPVIDDIVRRECPALSARESLAADLKAIAERFARFPLGQRMAAEPETLREAPFLLRVGEELVNGAIDALFPDGTVIDYKTGRPDASARARYEAQVRLYAAAVRRLLKRQPPKAYLYYADADMTHEVDVSPECVEAVLRRAHEAIENVYGTSA